MKKKLTWRDESVNVSPKWFFNYLLVFYGKAGTRLFKG